MAARSQRASRSHAVDHPGLPVASLLELLAIPGPSGRETQVAQWVTDQLRAAGVPQRAIRHDRANRHSPYGGELGNLICTLPGRGQLARAPRRMLSAHLDTVPLAVGCQPVQRGEYLLSADSATALGGDNRAGVAVALGAVLDVLHARCDHPPLTLLLTVQEEVGLKGAAGLNPRDLGNPKLGFNFDGGGPAKLTIGATGAYRLAFDVTGIASHAGVNPAAGVSAITIAGLAIADLQTHGWLGAVCKGQQRGTSNVGILHAGDATNVVCPHARVRAEVRSHRPAFRRRLRDAFIRAFKHAARQLRSSDGACGSVACTAQLDYESYRLRASEPCVRAARRAVEHCDAQPLLAISDGGLDANYLVAKGIPTVTLGAGQEKPHTTAERLHVPSYQLACQIAHWLARGLDEA